MNSDLPLDVYAHTNPAFWALALGKFVDGYSATDKPHKLQACSYPLLFLPMPLTFSCEPRRRFEGTNKKTGFMSWLQRNPGLRATAAAEMTAAKPYSRRAITFALAYDLISSEDGWNYMPGSGSCWKKLPWSPTSDERGAILRACGRLGQWCSVLDVATVFIALGARP